MGRTFPVPRLNTAKKASSNTQLRNRKKGIAITTDDVKVYTSGKKKIGKTVLRVKKALGGVLSDSGRLNEWIQILVDDAVDDLKSDVAGDQFARSELWGDVATDFVPRDVLDVHGINSILPAFLKVEGEDVIFDVDMVLGFTGPLVLATFRILGILEFVSVPITLATIIVLIFDRNRDCPINWASSTGGKDVRFELHDYLILKVFISTCVFVANVLLQRYAWREFKIAQRSIKEDQAEIKKAANQAKKEGKKEAILINMLRTRRTIDTVLRGGLEMLASTDVILTSWRYRVHQFLFIPELIVDSLAMVSVSLAIQTKTRNSFFQQCEANHLMGMMMFIAFWAAFLLIVRLLFISMWCTRWLFFTKVGLFQRGLKYMKKKDKSLFFGLPLIESLFLAFYGPDRKERVRLAHEPLEKRTAFEFTCLRIKRLKREKKLMTTELNDVTQELRKLNLRAEQLQHEARRKNNRTSSNSTTGTQPNPKTLTRDVEASHLSALDPQHVRDLQEYELNERLKASEVEWNPSTDDSDSDDSSHLRSSDHSIQVELQTKAAASSVLSSATADQLSLTSTGRYKPASMAQKMLSKMSDHSDEEADDDDQVFDNGQASANNQSVDDVEVHVAANNNQENENLNANKFVQAYSIV